MSVTTAPIVFSRIHTLHALAVSLVSNHNAFGARTSYDCDTDSLIDAQEEETAEEQYEEGAEDASEGAGAGGAAADVWVDKPWRKKQESASDKTSELLSEKMLQGWALLEQCCPR